MIANTLDLPPGISSLVTQRGDKTELFVYVLSGGLQMTIAGSDEELETGDCAFLDTDIPVIWCALGDAPCRLLTVHAPTKRT
jgi:uncharacterized cupin superfamily protein